MSFNMKIDVRDLKELINKSSPQQVRKASFLMANQILLDTNRFVPLRFGDLRDSGHVAPDGSSIIWSAQYASFVYDMDEASAWTTAGTTSHWDEPATQQYQEQWGQVFMKGLDF
ncbi:hypothetical protein EQG49_11190 [Periweissella cryptocerci]|uniref:Minor capsid protein n=1 Tax=Periweissella cryptocerci TaxID=2506420 RepID=A0A4P6YW10_9LACO|nr:minor capsid protein [Periweissella cryptocerci]QBO36971.1 hypothetical protein EQG49_11190 [Periweissella cryptocerci]